MLLFNLMPMQKWVPLNTHYIYNVYSFIWNAIFSRKLQQFRRKNRTKFNEKGKQTCCVFEIWTLYLRNLLWLLLSDDDTRFETCIGRLTMPLTTVVVDRRRFWQFFLYRQNCLRIRNGKCIHMYCVLVSRSAPHLDFPWSSYFNIPCCWWQMKQKRRKKRQNKHKNWKNCIFYFARDYSSWALKILYLLYMLWAHHEFHHLSIFSYLCQPSINMHSLSKGAPQSFEQFLQTRGFGLHK